MKETKVLNSKSKSTNCKRSYKSPRKSRDPGCSDPFFDITYFETGKRKKCYACPDLVFVSDVDYLFHLEDSHEGQRMHCCICSQCGKTFGSASELQQHTLSKCGTQPRFTCVVCDKKLMSAGSLYTHMLLHGDSNYTCNFCGKQFHNIHHMKAHERTHTKVPLYTCEVCGKGFAHRQSIITHSSLHTGIKPYSCEHCGKGFSCISNLLKHRKTHATTCGALPLTSHRIKNAETKMRIRMNTPATAKQKNYSQFKMVELEEKRTINAVRLLTKKKDLLLDDMLNDDNIKSNIDENDLKDTNSPDTIKDIQQTKFKKKNLKRMKKEKKKNKPTKCDNKNSSTEIDIIKHEVDIKPILDKNVLENTDKSLLENDCVLKIELHQDINFDSDDSMPLSTYIASCKTELPEISLINENKIDDLNGSDKFENFNSEDIACNICTSLFKMQEDFDLHMKNHSTDKVNIEYVEGFEENDLDNDDNDDDKDRLHYGDYDDRESTSENLDNTSNDTMKRKGNSTNLEHDDLLIEIKKPKLSKARKRNLVSEASLMLKKKDLVKIYKKDKSKKKRTTLKERLFPEENKLEVQVKNEVISELEDLIIENNKSNDIASQFSDKQDKIRYECKICGRSFKRRNAWQKHHHNKDNNECAGQKTKQKISKEINYTIIYNDIKESFPEDDSASLDNVPLVSRIKVKNRLVKGRQQFRCKICGTILKYKKSMLKHQISKGFKNEEGDECGGPSLIRLQRSIVNTLENTERSNYYNDYKEFVETKKKNRKVQCEVCKKTFAGMYLLKKHQRNKFNEDHSGLPCATVGNQKVRKCDYCALYLEKGAALRDHKKTVHADILTCDICHKVFSRPTILDYHRKVKHKLVPLNELPKRGYIYVCDKCGAQYKHKSSLLEHERTGCSSGPLFQCDRCDARLHNIYTLKTHMWKHVEEKKHLCTFCGMKFMMKVQLKNHLYRHTGEKPFKCSMCPKAFAHSTSLDTHISTHTGIKRYICLACGKRFSCYGNLDKHKASKSCKEWYNLNGEKKKLRILDEKPVEKTT